MICCAFCGTSSTGAYHVREICQTKSNVFVASSAASQGLGARICLKSARSCLNHFTNQCKNTRGNVSRAENATEQGPSSWTGPQLSCFANSTQHPFKEHQLAVTLLRCASLQFTSVGPCKTWPFRCWLRRTLRKRASSVFTCVQGH